MKTAIKNYLDNRAKTDELFAAKYANPKKSIDECCKYITGEAYARAKNGCAVISDEEVYGMAVHYYDEENIEIRKQPAGTKVSAKANVELAEDDKEKARELAVQEYKQQCIDKLKAADDAKAKKAAEKKKAQLEKRKEAELSIPNLFQFD